MAAPRSLEFFAKEFWRLQPLRITRHARNQLRYWRLTDADVQIVVEAPDLVTPSHSGRSNQWKQTQKGLVRVTTIEEAGRLVVITVGIVGPRHRPVKEC